MPAESGDIATDKLDRIIGNLLRAGVILSGSIVLLGGLIYLSRHGSEAPAYHVFRGEPSDLRTIRGVIQDVQAVRARGIIQLGLLLLIATPVARVAFLVYAFARRKDWMYSAIALSVLALLAYSLSSGHS